MEDVLVLDEMFKRYPNDRMKVFEEYSKHRNPDAEAMCDLAMYNYIEVSQINKKIIVLLVMLDSQMAYKYNTMYSHESHGPRSK